MARMEDPDQSLINKYCSYHLERTQLDSFLGHDNRSGGRKPINHIFSFVRIEDKLLPCIGNSAGRSVRMFRALEEGDETMISTAILSYIERSCEYIPGITISGYDNDYEALRRLLGHSYKWDIVTDPGTGERRRRPCLITSPLMGSKAELRYDGYPWEMRSVDTVYYGLSSKFNAWIVQAVDYIGRNHPGLKGDICLFHEKGAAIDETGEIRFIAAMVDDMKYTILRDVTVRLSPLLLLDHRLPGKYAGVSAGIYNMSKISTLESLIRGNALFMAIHKLPVEDERPLYQFVPLEFSQTLVKDDLGRQYSPTAAVIDRLEPEALPSHLLEREYPLVGVQYYAPYSSIPDKNCILVAETDNVHDDCAVKVLRWFPVSRTDMESDHMGVYEWGYVSRMCNRELHGFMVLNSCRILVGKTSHSGMIHIIGGIEQFNGGSLKEYIAPRFMYELYNKA